MAVYSEYLDRKLDFPSLTAIRKEQLQRISSLRGGRDIFVYATALQKHEAPIAISYEDLLPISDQIENLSNNSIDVILETPGGSAEIAEDIVKLLRDKYEHVGFIVPGCAKSAGTIMAMAGDEILLEPSSSLGPIDAQIVQRGKVFSAHAFLEGLKKIKEEVESAGSLNRAYIPILQNISPGEIQSAENALDFAKDLVTQWLAAYKFKFWDTHSSTGAPVSVDEKKTRAAEIASALCDHGRWLTHGRSIKLSDLEEMRLKVTNYRDNPDLHDAIRRYYTLMRMSFETNIFKIFETTTTQVYRYATPLVPPPQPGHQPDIVVVEVKCGKCQNATKLQLNLETQKPLQSGLAAYPKDDNFVCPHCGASSGMMDLRRQIEAQSGKKVVLG